MNALRLIIGYVTAPFRFLLKGPTFLIAAPRRIWGMSPPARAAAVVAASLIVCTTIVVLKYIINDEVPHGEILLNPRWIIPVTAVLIATPAATYYFVRLWLEGDVSQFPDIDRAWDQGVAALAEKGLQLQDYPLYVMLGVANESASDMLLATGKITLVLASTPKGQAPIHWYASDQAIYLACTGTGRLGALNRSAAASAVESPGAPVTATMVVGRADSHHPFAGGSPFESNAPTGAAILGTLVASPSEGRKTDAVSPAARSSGMSHRDADEQTARLDYIFRRLRRARQPYCSNNGVLTILPHSALNDIVFAKEIPFAVRADLNTHYFATSLASSVTVLVTGMEAEEGFTELVRRVGLEHARNGRFGKGFDVWNLASDENLDALSSHACGSFEDWVYKLFAADDGVEQRSNGKLFALICWVRRHLQPRLRGVLVSGYAVDADSDNATPRLFSGCYFAATGRQNENQAFVRSVFDKLDQLAGELQWSDAALREEATYSWITRLLTIINAALLVAIGYFAYRCIAMLGQ